MQGEEIGRLAVQWGLLTQDRLDEAVASRPPQLGDYLVAKGYVSPEDLQRLREASRPRVPVPVAGQRLGKYTLKREIGRGGMSVVWEAVDSDLQRRVALKLLSASTQNPLANPTQVDDGDLPRFIREAQTAAKLQHPSIVKVHEAGCINGIYFIAMGLIEGGTLSEAAAGNLLDPRRAATVVRDIARALQYAHEQGILHRDVKPANIMLPPGNPATIMDFGLARAIEATERLTLTGIVVGTPNYMPPEQVDATRGKVEPRSDVYSMGAVLYEALTGSAPFDGENAMTVLLAVLTNDPVTPRARRAACPPELETICLKAMSKELERRYGSAGAMADDLDRYLQGEPILARPHSVAYRLKKKISKHRTVAAAVAVAAVILLAWGATAFAQARARDRQAQEHLARAKDLEGRGEFARAVLAFEALVLLDPSSAEGQDGRQRCAQKQRREEERRREQLRLEEEKRGLRAKSEAVANAIATGKELARKGDPQGAVKVFTEAIEGQPDFAEAYHQRAHAWEGLKEDAKARADLEKALSIDRGNPEYWVEVGNYKRRAKDFAAAREHYDAAIAGWPNYAEAYHQLAHLHQETGDPTRQEVALRKAIDRDGASVEFRRELGDLLGGRKEYAEAVTWYRRAVEIDPHHVESHHQMGHCLMHLKDPEAALVAFSNAIAHGQRGKFYADRAEAHTAIWIAGGRKDAERLEQMIADCTSCIEKEPGLWRPWLFRARGHRARRAFEPAKADYEKARQINANLEAQVQTELDEMGKEQKGGR